jgi:L-cysteine/cystine lyase
MYKNMTTNSTSAKRRSLTLPDLTHIQRIRQEMPATASHLYFNAGTFGPLPACVPQAMQERLQDEYTNGRLGAASWESIHAIHDSARDRVARLINADESEIALTANTGEGMNIVSYGINWQQGDEVITTNHEHYNALGPLYQIRDRFGVTIRFADLGPSGERPALTAIADLVTPRTRLIVLSHVLWTTGAAIDVSEVSYMGRKFGIPVLIDGAQSIGAIPVDVKALNVDFYAIPMQKWLCGPDGTGALYVRREAQVTIMSTYVGYPSMKHEEGVDWALIERAKRFEMGGRPPVVIAGQAAALGWLEETVGYEWLFARIASLSTYAYSQIQKVPGVTMLTPVAGASGLVSFLLEGHDDAEVVKHLHDKHNIYLRNIPSMKCLRVSTGFYNTEEEIDTLVQALQEV